MIDSHCHLNFETLSQNLNSVIERAKKNHVTAILSINTDPENFISHYNLIKNYQSIFISYGLHPQNVNSNNVLKIDDLNKFCNYEKVIGIGETGLDFFHSTEFKKQQYESFENHIECSQISKIPLIIHQRNSENEIIDTINKFQKKYALKLVFHCFTGSKKLINFCLDNDFYISLSGIITFKNADNIRNDIREFPINRILIETDSPFLTPVPHRGKSNEPSYVKYISEYLSSFFNLSKEEFNDTIDNNFYNLFSKAIRYNEITQ